MNTDPQWKRARFHLIVASLIAAVLAAVLFVPQNAFAAPAASPAAGTASASALTVEQMKQYVYAATNQVRYNAGLTTGYVRDPRLDAVAQAWAEQQYKNGAMSHNPSYSSQIPGGWQRAGENVASGYTYDKVVPAWVASPSHYANLTNDYTSIGIGYYEADGKRYWVQEFAKYPGTAVPTKPAAPAPTPAPTPPPATPPASPPATYPAEPAAPAGTALALGSPSFEGGSSGWSGGSGVEGPTTGARGGKYDLKATGGTVSQTVNVAPKAGEAYTATIWVKPGGSSKISGTVRLVAAGGGTTETASVNFTVSSGWMRVSVPLTITKPGHTSLRIEVALNSGDIRLDSASLVRTQNAPAAPAPAPSTTPAPKPTPTPTPPPTKPPASGGLLGGLLGTKPAAPAAPAPAPAPVAPAPAAPAPVAPAPAPVAPAPAPPSGLGGLLSGLLGG
jgi:uncharacterized protein YkwD